MKRLTDRRTAAELKANGERLRELGFEPSILDLRYIKLAEYEDAEELIKTTADVEPVKHGRWERRMGKIYTCSECNNGVSNRQGQNYSFCPYCGAIMDEREDNK